MASLRTMLEGVRSSFTPTLTESAFLEKGVITPDEFVAAGDQLVAKCPTWEWAAGDASKAKAYLPQGKQYLVTRGVPSLKRVAALNQDVQFATPSGPGAEEFGDWLAPEMEAGGAPTEGAATIMTSATGGLSGHVLEADEFPAAGREEESGVSPVAAALSQSEGGPGVGAPPDLVGASTTIGVGAEEDEEEFLDMDDFDGDNLVDDAGAAGRDGDTIGAGAAAQGELVAVRTYTMHVVYDNFHRTPRVFLAGSSETGVPLSAEAMQDDVVQDYVQKTVTMETHPHLEAPTPHISIHPCQHAVTMKRLMGIVLDGAREQGVEGAEEKLAGRVDLYLFLFLKFVQSVVPTIEYDTTADFELSLGTTAAVA